MNTPQHRITLLCGFSAASVCQGAGPAGGGRSTAAAMHRPVCWRPCPLAHEFHLFIYLERAPAVPT